MFVSDLFKRQKGEPFLLIFSKTQVAENWLPGCSMWAMVIVYPAYKNKTDIKNFGFPLYDFC